MRHALVLAAAVLVACQSSPQPRAGEAGATPAPSSPANPAGGAVTGASPTAPPAAGQPATAPLPAADASATAGAAAEKPAVDPAAMDTSADPCGDFYQYACGGWLKSTPIPADRSLWGRGFSEINERNQAVLRDILEKGAQGQLDAADPYAQKVSDFYATCMDEQKAETASLATLQQELARIDAAKDRPALAAEVARLHRFGAEPLFGFGSQQDFKDATQVIGGVDQGGLTLPDRDYYFPKDPNTKSVRDFLPGHIAAMLQLAGASPAAAKKQAEAVVRIETALAKASMDKVERRDPNKIYHRLEREGLKKTAPHFDWDTYLAELGAKDLTAINVSSAGFFSGLDGVVSGTKSAELHTYLRWHLLRAAAPTLGQKFVEQNFRFQQKLAGAKAILPRWKRCVSMTDRALGEALGRSFVTTTIGEEGKKQAKQMIEGIEGAFRRNLPGIDWMDDATRAASVDKLQKIANKVGYPDRWRDYSAMQIGRESLLANEMAAADFEAHRDLAKIGKPVDRAEWGMSPPTVNAYYNPLLNEMVFPAGIMQTPFFRTDAPTAANYGGLGMVMGHELTHGFDDQGSQFDGNGNLTQWWSEGSRKGFTERTECVAKQYDGYVAIADQHLNGHLTLGENIADIGGLKLALAAFREKRGGNVSQEDVKQFFTAFAQSWCTNYRPEAARLQALTNPHSTAQWRVNGPVSDNADFAAAFQCKAGAPLAPQNRCVVW